MDDEWEDDELDEKSGPFSIVDRCSLTGQVAVILCWWIDGEDESDEPNPFGDLEDMQRFIRLIPQLLTGQTQKFRPGHWWTFFDALASYPEPTPVLRELSQICHDRWNAAQAGKPLSGPTKSFVETDDFQRKF